MRLLWLTLFLFPAFAVQVGGEFLMGIDFSVSGDGNGQIEVMEYPGNFSGQVGYCSSTEIDFPPYQAQLVCSVTTSPRRDIEYEDYEVSNLTEVDDQMAALALGLIEGDVENFDKAVSLAAWVRGNVEYDLGVGDTQQNAKWTYYSRIGTCDELAHLFIALSRSVGLSARYVAGYVWDGKKWLPHAWAEVWTRYGWAPVDVAFDQYGHVDGNHIATYKGADGDHNFILIYYYGQASVSHSFSITRLSETNATLFYLENVSGAYGNASVLVELGVENPFPTKLAFFPTLVPTKDFTVELLYPTGPVILSPGRNRLQIVLHFQKVRQGYVYSVPTGVQLGAEQVPLLFKIVDNYLCPAPRELEPYTYDVSGCMDLEAKGLAVGPATSGAFFCDKCFYSFEEPSSRSYQLQYPDFCEGNCSISVEVVGSGKYRIKVNGQTKQGFADIYQLVEFPLEIGVNNVTIDGVLREIEVRSPPAMELSQEQQGSQVCFKSNWKGAGCHELLCGGNSVTMELKYGRLSKTVTREVVRECNVFESLWEFVRGMLGI